jgi:CHAD domain-containing protein
MSIKSVIAAIHLRWDVASEAPSAVHRTYLDTADWRIHRRGLTLDMDDGASSPVGAAKEGALTLRHRESEAVVAWVPADGPPTFASDLPVGDLWGQVATVIEDRRLLPQVEVDTHLQRIAVLNSDDKTTARVLLERHTLTDSRERSRVLRTATVTGVRGYERSAQRIADALSAAGLEQQTESLLNVALSLAGRPSPGAKSGPAVDLERSMPAARAVASILGRLRYHMISTQEGVREQLDTEFLHDYRVAIRRARSILRQAHGALPPNASGALAAGLGWLGSLTGPARDLDVHLGVLGSTREDLAPLNQYLIDRREKAQRDLIDAMDSERYRSLLHTWRALEKAETDQSAAPLGDRPAGQLADALIARAYRRVVRRGRAIDVSTPAEALHDLRKRAKELRYLIECFQSLYPEDEITSVIRELKALQDNLGEFQDCQVQADALRSMAADLFESRAAPATTLMAMGRLADDLGERERRARDEFDSRFERFSSSANRKRLAALVSGGLDGTDSHGYETQEPESAADGIQA